MAEAQNRPILSVGVSTSTRTNFSTKRRPTLKSNKHSVGPVALSVVIISCSHLQRKCMLSRLNNQGVLYIIKHQRCYSVRLICVCMLCYLSTGAFLLPSPGIKFPFCKKHAMHERKPALIHYAIIHPCADSTSLFCVSMSFPLRCFLKPTRMLRRRRRLQQGPGWRP